MEGVIGDENATCERMGVFKEGKVGIMFIPVLV